MICDEWIQKMLKLYNKSCFAKPLLRHLNRIKWDARLKRELKRNKRIQK